MHDQSTQQQAAIFGMARRFGADQIAPYAREWENAGMIAGFGDARAHARRLPRAVAMETIFSYCLTEPGSGSDAAALRTRAEARPDARGGGWVLNGTPGLSFGPPEDKVGWRAQPTAQAQFDDCVIPAQNLLGEEGRGFAYAVAGLDGGRLNIAACALGGAQYAMDKTLIYMSERQAFGQSLDQFQALQFRLAEIEVKLQLARSFLHHAANMLDGGAADAAKFCAMAKLLVTDNAFDAANQCLQLHGGYGYLADYGIEKIVRDLRVHQILEGTNEIMRVIIARSLLAGPSG